ncbi:MAG: hypothetical protein M1827_000535 [Pycnora praestabilis]|nr:MAG: hypothetical protein M1827_000535 [Pycnora praestabilis]
MSPTLEKESSTEEDFGILPSHGISLDVPAAGKEGRPPLVKHFSSPAYESPIRHHQRKHSTPRKVKVETLHARSEYTNSEDDGGAQHRINQYIIKQEIGRGSFGAVHLAVDQHGEEYAVKEFSKSRLRKRAQSNILRRPNPGRRPGHLAAGLGLNSPLHRHSASDIHDQEEAQNPLYLIKEEIAIMKKLNHPNLVSLIEVLDDPNEDSLYMVLEMCKKGVIMKVGLEEKSDPYDDESCRCWFRDMILGIEYLHAQGVVHRDIKPDNCLLTDDDVLKIVDFGVSEMFEKTSEMLTAKSAGSPAFLPPELCVARHGGISGKAADIWSMGITLYCLRYGAIPFEKPGVLDLYESIKSDPIQYGPECDPDFKDLISKLLEKDPSKRIHMEDLREHPWVTKQGTDPLLSKEDNTADLVEPPTEEEMNSAITGNLSNLLVLMKAVKKFKNLLYKKRPDRMQGILGGDVRIVQPPVAMSQPNPRTSGNRTRSVDTHNRRPVEQALVAEGVHHEMDMDGIGDMLPRRMDSAVAISTYDDKDDDRMDSEFGHKANPHTPQKGISGDKAKANSSRDHTSGSFDGHHRDSGKGHAHNPLEETLFLDVGPGGGVDPPLVSESPPAAEINIYETAYQGELEKIREAQGHKASIYLTRRVEHKKEYKEDPHLIGKDDEADRPKGGIQRLLQRAREKGKEKREREEDQDDA